MADRTAETAKAPGLAQDTGELLTLGGALLGLAIVVFWIAKGAVALQIPFMVSTCAELTDRITAVAVSMVTPVVGPLLAWPTVILLPIAVAGALCVGGEKLSER